MLAALAAILLVVALSLIYVPAPVEAWLQSRVLGALQQKYGRDVQIENLHVSVVPVFKVTADNFVLPSPRGPGNPPFLTIQHLIAEAQPLQLTRRPVHLSWVKLEGMVIQVPPKREKTPEEAAKPKSKSRLANFEIDRVDADGTVLYVLPKQAGRAPMEWDLHALRLKSAGIGQAMQFVAELTNAKPPGLIHTTGKFGPWNQDGSSQTPLSGRYDFKNADLSVFNGISGILSSAGDYTGQLDNIVVDGSTETPDFKLDNAARSVHLFTQFHAIVDGTNGNTYLQPVNAQFLNSRIVAKGEVATQPGDKGKSILLDITIQNSKVQDVFNLAADSAQPMITGDIDTKAKLAIPPGKEKMLQKIRLAGTFNLANVHFTGDKAKSTVAALSRRAQGKPNDMTIEDVPAQMTGTFVLRDSMLSFSKLTFSIPGVDAQAKGTYGLQSGSLDFVGEVKLDAHVSQTMTGINRVLLKPIDPIMARHHAGTYLPINVSGDRSQPKIKLDVKKIF
jgi:uncharacterized protein involved in outer membrane biogenesis